MVSQRLLNVLALIKLYDHLLTLYTCVIIFDLKKAFETANHQVLLGKLHHCGAYGVSLMTFCMLFTKHVTVCMCQPQYIFHNQY